MEKKPELHSLTTLCIYPDKVPMSVNELIYYKNLKPIGRLLFGPRKEQEEREMAINSLLGTDKE